MAGNIYIPPPPNQWAESMSQLGSFLGNLALTKIAQNFREREAQMQAAREDIRLKQQEQSAERLKGIGGVISGALEEVPTEARQGEENIANTMKLGGKTFRVKEKPKPVEVTVAGHKFAWIPGTEKLVSLDTKDEEEKNLGQLAEFEKFQYGRLVPELRGTTDYQRRRLAYAANMRPYYSVVQTGEGFGKVDTRKPGSGITPITDESGQRVGGRLPPNDIEELQYMKTTYDRLNDVNKKLESPELKDKTGPLSGRWTALKLKFLNDGPTQTVVNELNSMITLAYSLSGKQISYREMEILQEAILPNLKQPGLNLQATINAAQRWLARTHDDRLQGFKGSGYQTNIEPLTKTEQGKKPTHRFVPGKGIVPVGD